MTKAIVEHSIDLIGSLVDDEVLSGGDLARFVGSTQDPHDPENLRRDLESWYRTLGIETVTGQRFQLSPPPFTSAELRQLRASGQLVLCVPRGITRRQLGEVFRLDSWALDDEFVPEGREVEDFWFAAGTNPVPEQLNASGAQVRRVLEQNGRLGMTLSRYMAFAARLRHVSGRTPDVGHLVWLTRSQYDRRGLLVAGFDRMSRFRVHAWMPSFQGSRCGARPLFHPDHL